MSVGQEQEQTPTPAVKDEATTSTIPTFIRTLHRLAEASKNQQQKGNRNE